LRLVLTPEFLALFPDAVVGVAAASALDNAGSDPRLADRLRRAETGLESLLAGAVLTEHPRIAVWRDAYRRFGAKPKDHPSSIENLARRVRKGQALPHVNKLVDIYNAVSLETLLPAGGEDLDAVAGDIELAIAGEREPAVRLLGESEERPPKAGEVIYRDRAGALCRRWNWKEADRTKLTESTRRALLVVEGLPPIERESVSGAIDEIARLVRAHCGGRVETALLDRERPELEIPSG